MIRPGQKLAILVGDQLLTEFGKMATSILHHAPYDVVCLIGDGAYVGQDARAVTKIFNRAQPIPIVSDVAAAIACGAEVVVIGIAPLGGVMQPSWLQILDDSVTHGLSIVNGLFIKLAPRYSGRLQPAQYVWDIRTEPPGLTNATGAAAALTTPVYLMVGTDMAVGKKFTGLKIYHAGRAVGYNMGFVATGQGGIVIMGNGIPLDAICVDKASGAVEAEVLKHRACDFIIVEGQGAIHHPASTAFGALIHGAQPTGLILCHRAGRTHYLTAPNRPLSSLARNIASYEDLANPYADTQQRLTRVAAISLNTQDIARDQDAKDAIDRIADDTCLPVFDPVRPGFDGAAQLFAVLQRAHPHAQPTLKKSLNLGGPFLS